MKTVSDFLLCLDDPRRKAIQDFHDEHADLMREAAGSAHNHQAWPGGYLDHVAECLRIAEAQFAALSSIRPLPFSFAAAAIVLYFHDVEKIFKYSRAATDIDKDDWYANVLPGRGIVFSPEEANALAYIHGETDDHVKTARRMGRLAAFCHACDVLSARLCWDECQGAG